MVATIQAVPPTPLPWWEQGILHINGSKWISGLVMLFLNLGSKYIPVELSKRQEQILNHPIVRRLMVFTIFFTSTRDVVVSFILTGLYIIIMLGLSHVSSQFCLIPRKWRDFPDESRGGKTTPSPEEITQATKILQKVGFTVRKETKGGGSSGKKRKESPPLTLRQQWQQRQQRVHQHYQHNIELFRNYHQHVKIL